MRGLGPLGWLRSWRGRRSGRPRAEVRIRVEFYQDDPGWVFRVPSLDIVGGAPDRQEALDRCLEAIRFALEAPGDASTESSQNLYVDAELTAPRKPVLA